MKKTFFVFLIVLLVIFTAKVHAQLRTDSNTVRTKVGEPKSLTLADVPTPPQDIRQGLINEFGVTMNGFDQDHLLWSWEKFWVISQTRFMELIRGSVIEASSGGLSAQVGCFSGGTTVRLGQYNPKEFFQFIILHELAHAIQACHPRSVSKQVEQQNAYSQEGAISYYAGNTSVCISGFHNNFNEDYADMIAYFLDSAAGFSSGPSGCGPSSPPNPYLNGGFKLHNTVAGSILL